MWEDLRLKHSECVWKPHSSPWAKNFTQFFFFFFAEVDLLYISPAAICVWNVKKNGLKSSLWRQNLCIWNRIWALNYCICRGQKSWELVFFLSATEVGRYRNISPRAGQACVHDTIKTSFIRSGTPSWIQFHKVWGNAAALIGVTGLMVMVPLHLSSPPFSDFNDV